MNKKLVIFSHGGGRLANQMTNHAHLVAFQRENEEQFEVINLAFGPFSQLFKSMKGNKIPTLPNENKRLKVLKWFVGLVVRQREYKMTFFNQVLRLIHFLFAVLPDSQSLKFGRVPSYLSILPGTLVADFDLNDPDSIAILKKKGITILAGWPVRSWELFRKHESTVRCSFSLEESYMNNAKRFMEEIELKFELLIGVLIRQDDYRTWAQGKYFFHTEEYAEIMRQIEEIFPSKRVAFIVASDEMQDINTFGSLNVFFTTGSALGTAHFIESFAELTLCHYVLTPPSTFGVWAAFLGDVPVIPFYEKKQKLKIGDFLVNHIHDCLNHPHMSISVN